MALENSSTSDSKRTQQPINIAEMKRRRLRYQESEVENDSDPILPISTHDTLRSQIPRPKRLSISFEDGSINISDDLLRAIFECEEAVNPMMNKKASFSSFTDLQDYISGTNHSSSSSVKEDSEREKDNRSSSSSKEETRRFSLKKEEPIPIPLFSGPLSFEKGKTWKTRTFALTDSGICYLRKTNSIGFTFKPKYSFLVNYKDISEILHDESCFIIDESCFAIQTPTQRFYLKASTKKEMFSWMLDIARQRNLSLLDKSCLIY